MSREGKTTAIHAIAKMSAATKKEYILVMAP
jgi:hypothetical protein